MVVTLIALAGVAAVAGSYLFLDRWSAACVRAEESIEWRDYE